MLYALAPELKTIPATEVSEESVTLELLETSKDAVSEGLFGTVLGVQLAAVFQLALVGLRFQVALPARARFDRRIEPVRRTAERKENGFIPWFYRYPPQKVKPNPRHPSSRPRADHAGLRRLDRLPVEAAPLAPSGL